LLSEPHLLTHLRVCAHVVAVHINKISIVKDSMVCGGSLGLWMKCGTVKH
ncbi:hypothetical protein CUMW_248190, partial [Citrus unshiu]